MQNKIMARSTFEAEIYNDPIKLLNAVKEQHALNYQETRYEMSIISDAFRALFTVQQKESKSLQDHTRRFKTAREILESHLGGQIVLTKFVCTMPKYDLNNAEANT
jgi:thiamine monophosphate kinase